MKYRTQKGFRTIFKITGFILLVLLLTVFFVEPVRKYLVALTHKDKDNELKEEQIIGTVSGYNSRVEDIQQILKDIGLEPGPVDGVMGYKTRNTIKEFQKTKGLKTTGRIDSVTWLALNRDKEAMKPVAEVIPLTNLPSAEDVSVVSKQEEIKIELQGRGNKTQGGTEYSDTSLNVTENVTDRAKQIQIALKKAGFYKGKVDGKIGPQTSMAIREFQKSRRLKPDGIVGPKTWKALSGYLKNIEDR